MKYRNSARALALVLAGMLACPAVSVQAATFADINNVPWPGAEKSINAAADLGLVVGETVGGKSYFRPKDPVSLTQACQFAYKVMLQSGKAQEDSSLMVNWFSDMSANGIQPWAYPAVSYCLEHKIIDTNDLKTFVKGEVNVSATREQAAEILGRALAVGVPTLKPTATTTIFKDNASITADARPYIALLNSQKIVNGDDVGKFNPKSTLNRTETAVMVTNLYNVLKNTASEPVVTLPTSQSGKVAAITNFYVNFENNTAYYLFSSSSISATLNEGKITVAELATLFKNGTAIDATVTLDANQRVTKIEATSEAVATEEKATEGKLTDVYCDEEDDKGSVTLDGRHKHKTDDYSDMLIEIDEQEYNLDELAELLDECNKNGESIMVTVTLNRNDELKKVIGTITSDESGTVKGTLTDVEYEKEDGEGEIELNDKDDYAFDDDTSIKIDGSKSDGEDLVKLFNEYEDEEMELRITVTLDDDDYAKSIEITTKGESSSSDKAEIIDMDNKSDDKGAIQLDGGKKYTIADVDALEVEVVDGDEEIDNWDDLYTAQIDDNKTIEAKLEFEDGKVVGITGEVVWVKGLLASYDAEEGYLSVKAKESNTKVDYLFDTDEADMEDIPVKGLKSGVTNMLGLINYFKAELKDNSDYDVRDEEWTVKLTLKNGNITKVEKG